MTIFFRRGAPDEIIGTDEMRAAQRGVLHGRGELTRVLHSLEICARLSSRLERLSILLLAIGAVAAAGCSGRLAARKLQPASPPERAQTAALPSSLSAQNGSPAASSSITATASAETSDFVLPIPAGYRNASAEFPDAGFSIVLATDQAAEHYRSTIVIRRVPIPGGSFDEPAECEQTGRGLIQGGTDEPGTGGKLNSAHIIDGPVGKTCQIQLTAPEGVALVTELHRPGNTRSSPKDIWLMTCNYVDRDVQAESACRFALSGFRFRNP